MFIYYLLRKLHCNKVSQSKVLKILGAVFKKAVSFS